jgi:large subunit ribosomal protein L20
MTRVTRGFVARRRRQKIFRAVRGCRAGRVRLFRTANQQAMKSRAYMYVSRKRLKRTMRQVWIKRINASVRTSTPGMTYSRFIHDLHISACHLNRKSLAQLASLEPRTFLRVVTHLHHPVGSRPSSP